MGLHRSEKPPETRVPSRPLDGRRQPADFFLKRSHAGRVERVVDLGPLAACLDQAGLPQDLQVLADCRLADREDLGEVTCARPALRGEASGDAEPDGMAKRFQL